MGHTHDDTHWYVYKSLGILMILFSSGSACTTTASLRDSVQLHERSREVSPAGADLVGEGFRGLQLPQMVRVTV